MDEDEAPHSGLPLPRNLSCLRKTAAKSQATRGLTHVSFLSSYCRALVHPPFPTRQRWFFFGRQQTLGPCRLWAVSGSAGGFGRLQEKPKKRGEPGMAHSSTSEPPVGQPPINSPDAVAGASGCQGGPDEKEHSSNRTSKENGKCADALNVQAQITSRDAAFRLRVRVTCAGCTSQG